MTGTFRVTMMVLAATLCMTAAGCGSGTSASGGSGAEDGGESQDADALQKRYAALANEVDEGARSIGRRMNVIAGVDERGPAEQLAEALGPSKTEIEEDSFACSLGGVSCEVGEFENLLANDREDFADEDEYSPNNCNITTETSYYEGYDLADTEDGANYVELHDGLSSASDGLSEDAEGLVGKAREMEEAERAYEEASGFEGTQGNWSAAEVEGLSEGARAAEGEAEDALAPAEERWAGYEARAEEARAEALALHDREGC